MTLEYEKENSEFNLSIACKSKKTEFHLGYITKVTDKLPLRGRPILLFTRMITGPIGLHSVLLPLLIVLYQADDLHHPVFEKLPYRTMLTILLSRSFQNYLNYLD